MATASDKVLVPGTATDGSSSATENLEVAEIVSDNSQASQHETLPELSIPHPTQNKSHTQV